MIPFDKILLLYMVTLLYHWNFTGANDLNVNDIIYDSEANLSAVLKSRGTISLQVFQEVKMVYY